MFTRNFYNVLGTLLAGTTTSNGLKDIYGDTKDIMYNSGSSGYLYELAQKLTPATISASYTAGGIVLGTGTTLPTLDDYILAGSRVTTISGSLSVTREYDSSGITVKCTCTITNTGSDSITIGEIGYCGSCYIASGATRVYLIDRTVLDSPITIPASGIGQVTYTIRMEYPTA